MRTQDAKTGFCQWACSNSDLLVLVLLGVLISQTWFKEGYVIAGADFFPSVNQIETLQHSVFGWDYYELGLGLPQYYIAYLIQLVFLSFFSLFGLSLPVIERIWLTTWFVLPAVSMYVLSSIVLKGNRIARFAASFFYMVNMFLVISFWLIVATWAYILIPLLLAVLIKGFESVSQNRKVFYWAALFSIASVGLSYLSVNPAVLAVPLIALGAYAVFHFIFGCSNDHERIGVMKFLSVCFVLSVLLNVWWIVPLHSVLFETPTSNPIKTSIDDWGWSMARHQFVHVFQLSSAWSFIEYYYPYAPVFSSNQLLIAASFAPSLLAFAALAFPELRKNRFLVYAVLMVPLLLFLSKGIQPPFDGIYRWVYASVPFFWMFREPAAKFFMIFLGLYAVLIGFTVSKLCEKAKETISTKKIGGKLGMLSYAPLAVALLLFSVASYVIFTGEIVPAQRKDLPSMNVKIPEYWYEAAEFINSQPDEFRVLMLPKDGFYQIGYGWGYYGTDMLPRHFFKKPSILFIDVGGYYTNYRSLNFISAIYTGLYEDENFPLADALAMANIKYVIQRNDIDWTRFGGADLGSPEKIKGLMSGKKEIRLEKTIGSLDVYMNEKNSGSMITAYTEAAYINGTISDMFYMQAKTSVKRVFFLNGSNEGNESTLSSISDERIVCNAGECSTVSTEQRPMVPTPTIQVTKNNPTSYEVSVSGAYAPYWLVFSDSYDPGWAIYYKGWRITEHYVANGYANIWRIEERGGYTLTMEYEPQKKMYYAYAISLIAFATLSLYAVFQFVENKNKSDA